MGKLTAAQVDAWNVKNNAILARLGIGPLPPRAADLGDYVVFRDHSLRKTTLYNDPTMHLHGIVSEVGPYWYRVTTGTTFYDGDLVSVRRAARQAMGGGHD